MDCKLDARQSSRIEFTWHGFDEGDAMSGRGRAEIVGDEMQGHLYIHLGDDSAFRAVRPELPRASRHASAGQPEPR